MACRQTQMGVISYLNYSTSRFVEASSGNLGTSPVNLRLRGALGHWLGMAAIGRTALFSLHRQVDRRASL